jgi:hypothetical protein
MIMLVSIWADKRASSSERMDLQWLVIHYSCLFHVRSVTGTCFSFYEIIVADDSIIIAQIQRQPTENRIVMKPEKIKPDFLHI